MIDINRNLLALTTCERGSAFPHHFNLAIRDQAVSKKCEPIIPNSTGLIQAERLRQQNRHLNQDLHVKTDRIQLLEQEKDALIREVYQLQQHMGVLAGVRRTGSPVCSSSSGGLGDADVVY